MDRLEKKKEKRELREFDACFRGLPVTNRLKLIQAAKSLLEVQRTGKKDLLPADAEKTDVS